MTTLKVYGLSCESQELALHLGINAQRRCHNTGPIGWRMKDFTSQQARAQAKREGWKRVQHQGQYGVVAYDICRTCYPQLEDHLKQARFADSVNAMTEAVRR